MYRYRSVIYQKFHFHASLEYLLLSYNNSITKLDQMSTQRMAVGDVEQLRKEDETSEITKDWKFAAMVVDRLCLIIFTLFTIISTVAVLFSAPNFIL